MNETTLNSSITRNTTQMHNINLGARIKAWGKKKKDLTINPYLRETSIAWQFRHLLLSYICTCDNANLRKWFSKVTRECYLLIPYKFLARSFHACVMRQTRHLSVVWQQAHFYVMQSQVICPSCGNRPSSLWRTVLTSSLVLR